MPETPRSDFLSQATRSVVTMRKMMKQETSDPRPDIDPFTDPVLYLMGLGIEAELVESREADLPSAA
jgi:hypothetical protein